MTVGLSGKKVVLIDGSGYIYRAFFALPQMTRADGTPVNAVYGFCSMLMKLVREMPADYMAVVFDAARKTFRTDLYPEYKATRRELPPELVPQFPYFRKAAAAFNIAQAELEGFEADDLLATYAARATAAGAHTVIVSADKDLMQMVGSGVTIFDPMKQRVVEEAQVLEKFGVTPDKVIDVQALAGDTSDNVPGVAGIGIKTAAALINEYGTLENLLANAQNIKQQKRRETLIAQREQAEISKRLVTLRSDAPVEKDVSDFAVKSADGSVLQAFFDDMGFKSLAAKLPVWLAAEKKAINLNQGSSEAVEVPVLPPPPAAIEKKYRLIRDLSELKDLLEQARENGIVAIDTETDSLSALRANIVGFSFCFKEGESFYVPLRHKNAPVQSDLFGAIGGGDDAEVLKQIPVSDALTALRPLLENKGVLKVGHNIKYDWHVFEREYGEKIDLNPIDDTMVLSYDLDGAAHLHNMDDLARLFLNYETIPYKDVCGTGKNKITFDRADLNKALDYAAEDADVTLRLHTYLKKRLIAEKRVALYETMDRPCVGVLCRMESEGICVSESQLKRLSRLFGEKMSAVEKKIFETAGEEFNLNSPAQLGRILFEKMGLSGGVKSAKTGAWGTDVSVLEELADNGHAIARDLIEYRQFSKLKNTYTDALREEINPKTGRVHTTFMQTGTSTGRLSSNDPNLQNIPVRSEEGREIRRAFIAPEGFKLLSADYSQIELRLLAHVADVKGLKDAFARGEDIHAATASQVFNVPIEGMDPMVRRSAKAINFGIVYGISAFGLSRQLGISRHEAQEYIDAYFQRFPEIRTYIEQTTYFAREHGYVMTPFGRKCSVGDLNDKNAARRQFAERSAVNAPIQGGAADILKKAMVKMPYRLESDGLAAKMLLQVHDELIFEVPENQIADTVKTVKDVMENVFSLSVALVAETGVAPNWAEAH